MHPSNQQAIAEEGGILALVIALGTGRLPSAPNTAFNASMALVLLAKNNVSNQQAIAAVGGIEGLIGALHEHADNKGVQEQCVAALSLCSLAVDVDNTAIQVGGSMEAVLSAP